MKWLGVSLAQQLVSITRRQITMSWPNGGKRRTATHPVLLHSAMIDDSKNFVHIGSLADLKAKGMLVVKGEHCPILVVYHDGRIFAVDNRCPHLGFPLHRGSIEDGILTCHWHHARFDLTSGGTFDPWADDLPTALVEVRDGEVWVGARTRYSNDGVHWRIRLREGLEQNIDLVIAKVVLGLTAEGLDYRTLVRD